MPCIVYNIIIIVLYSVTKIMKINKAEGIKISDINFL